jgi:hypothetical protein
MQSSEFLRIADELSKRPGDEAAIRTSVGRSYFALYNCVKQFIVEQGFRLPNRTEAHEYVYRFLNNCEVEEMVDIAGDLHDLRSDRNEADYDLDAARFQEGRPAVFCLIKARDCHKRFLDYTGSSANRRKVVRGISAYQKRLSSGPPPSV